MTAAAPVYTSSQEAQASILLSRSHAWVRGTRKSDGTPFVIFESSRQNTDGSKVGYMCRLDGRGCTCPSFNYRGGCSHQLAVTLYAQRVPDGWTPISAAEQAIADAQAARWRQEPEPVRRASRERDYGTVSAF